MVRMPVQNASTNRRVQEEVRTFVVLVEFWKMPSAPFHEFVVFHVEGPDPHRYKALIVVDRYVGDVSNEILQGHGIPEVTHPSELAYVTPPPVSTDVDSVDFPTPDEDIINGRRINKHPLNIFNASTRGISASIGLVGSMFKDNPSKDLITFVNKPTSYMDLVRPGSILCKKFTPPKDAEFSVSELAVLAHTIHKYNCSYHVIRYQCHWFSEIIYNVSFMRCGWVKEEVKEPNKPGKFGDTVQVHLTNAETPFKVYAKHKESWIIAKKKYEALGYVSLMLPSPIIACLNCRFRTVS